MATFARNVRVEDRVLAPKADRETAATATEAQPPAPKYASKLPGDGQTLRGLPAIGRGVSGAIPGTSPERVIAASDGSSTLAATT